MRDWTTDELKEHFSDNVFKQISATADELHMPCYVVGGYVRDLFLERPSKDIDVVVATLQRYGFTTVQLHGSEGVDYCDRLRAHGYKVLKAISISDEGDVARAALYDGHADLLVVDTKCNGKGGSGMKFDWRLLENATFATPFLLSGGIAATDAEAVAALYRSSAPRMAGVDINSRFETAPALKSPALISQFLSQLSQLIK